MSCACLVFASDVWKGESGSVLEMECWLEEGIKMF